MFSKLTRVRLFIALLTAVGLVAACVPKVGEDPPEQQIQDDGLGCLTDASQVVKDFIQGEAKTEEIAPAWNCFANAFQAFHKYVRGSDREVYSPQEIATFIEKNFFRTPPGEEPARISPQLQREFMKFKQVFVGGRRDQVSRAEVLEVISVTRVLSRLTVQINPYMKVFLIKWKLSGNETTDNRHFAEANEAIQGVAVGLAGLTREGHEAYRFNDFHAFIRELSEFFGEEWPAEDVIRRYLPVAKKVKKALAGGPEDRIFFPEWRRILLLGGRTYVQYLRYHYFIEKRVQDGGVYPIDYVADTVEDTFSIFEDLIAEKPSRHIGRSEMLEIFSALSAVLPTFKYSESLVDEFMKLKVAIFGGEQASLSVEDFGNARSKVASLRGSLTAMMPFMAVYGGTWKNDNLSYAEALEYFSKATSILTRIGGEAGAMLESSYDLNDGVALVREFQRLYPPKEKVERFAESAEKFLPLLMEVKNALFAERDSLLRKEQGVPFMTFSGRLYGTSLFFDYFLKGKSDRHPDTYDAVGKLAEQGLTLIADVLRQRANAPLSRAEIVRLAVQMQNVGWLPREIAVGTLEDILEVILNRILNPPERRLKGEKPNAISKAAIDYIRSEFQIWLQTQLFLMETFDWSDDVRIKGPDMRKRVAAKLKEPGISPALKSGLAGLGTAIGSWIAFVLDENGALRITRRGVAPFDLKSMEMHNLLSEVVRVFVASYAEQTARVRKSLTGPEASRAFADFRQAAIEYGVLDPSNSEFMNNRFREANLFMPRSDGDEVATTAEIHELVFSIVSGVRLDGKLQAKLKDDCKIMTRSIHERVRYGCLYRSYQRSFRTHFTAMPDFQRFQKDQTDEGFNLFFYNTLKGTGFIPNSDEVVPLADAGLMPPLIQYIELLYMRFDQNADQVISVDEAKTAFPAFRALFRMLAKEQLDSGQLKEEDLFAVFTWVLKHRTPPTSLSEKIKFLFWRANPHRWELAADRQMIANILGYIADQIRAKRKAGQPI